MEIKEAFGEFQDKLFDVEPQPTPIEKLLYLALLSVFHDGYMGATLSRQKRFGRYTADFVIAHPPMYRVIVEADGHDYHEKTKAQAAKDKRRDRFLQDKGYNVLRFTGSEITRDPFKCAEEVDSFISKKVSESFAVGRK